MLKWRKAGFFLFYFSHQTLFGTVLQHDYDRPMQHAAPHSSSPTTTCKILSWSSVSTDLNPNKHTWNELERCAWGRVSALQMCVSCFRHSSRIGWPSQHRWFKTWSSPCLRDAGQLLILEEDTPLLMCMSLSHKIPSDWTFSWTTRVLKAWTFTWMNCKMKYDELDF